MTFGSSFWKKGLCIHILWCVFMGLGHNDPWVKSHMWPQQTWGQRSSRGQWPLVQGIFLKLLLKRVTVSTYFWFPHTTLTAMGSNLIFQWLQKYMIPKAGETCGSRSALLWATDFWVMLSDFTVKKCKIGKEICIQLQLDWVETKCGVWQIITIICVTQ